MGMPLSAVAAMMAQRGPRPIAITIARGVGSLAVANLWTNQNPAGAAADVVMWHSSAPRPAPRLVIISPHSVVHRPGNPVAAFQTRIAAEQEVSGGTWYAFVTIDGVTRSAALA